MQDQGPFVFDKGQIKREPEVEYAQSPKISPRVRVSQIDADQSSTEDEKEEITAESAFAVKSNVEESLQQINFQKLQIETKRKELYHDTKIFEVQKQHFEQQVEAQRLMLKVEEDLIVNERRLMEAEKQQVQAEKQHFELKLQASAQNLQLIEIQLKQSLEEKKVLEERMKDLSSDLHQKLEELQQLRQVLSKSNSSTPSLELKNVDTERLVEVMKIGSGGFKEVFMCELDGKKLVAVAKIKNISKREQFTRQHIRELKAFAVSTGHPNVVQLEGWTKEGWIVMEYCPHTLRNVQPTLTFEKKMSVALEISRGLTFLHRLGLVHGDLKPDNILISANDVAKLSDFGFSYNVNSASVSTGTQTGGTVRYQAPELALSQKDLSSIDPRLKDIYALGGVLLFLFCGQEPWKGETIKFIESNQFDCLKTRRNFLPTEQLNHLLEEEKEDLVSISRIITRCFSTNPDSRGSSRQVMNELEAIMSRNPDPVASRAQETQSIVESTYLENVLKQMVVKLLERLETKQNEGFESMQRMLDIIFGVMNETEQYN
eukprot:TRINITY_DN2501_c0_g1_i5.p1 TRINITY_DN2501_c0_g1~~TRINITY_DN2501_c0_g1_i5.p1  ORF type:complete len:545 (-),score=162.34 TRINITY_DN2501_c0_g1_i5:220-1854(-)